MSRRQQCACLLGWSLLATACAAGDRDDHSAAPVAVSGESSEPSADLSLDASAQARLALRTEQLLAAEFVPVVEGFGTVLDPSSLFQLAAESAASTAQAKALRLQLARTQQLVADRGNASQEELEKATAAYEAEEAHRLLLERRLRLEWGAGADLAVTSRSVLLQRLAAGTQVIARLDLPAGTTLSTNRQARLTPLAGLADGISTAATWRAPTATARLPGEAWLALVPAAPWLRPGAELHVAVTADAPPLRGTIVPRAAVVAFQSQTWCFVRTADEAFARRAIALDRPLADGYFVDSQVSAGETVVTHGAALLLAAERAGAESAEAD